MWTNKTTRATEKIITNVFPNRLAEEILGFTSARWSNCQSGSLRAGCRIFRFPALSFIGRLYNQHHNYLYHSFSMKIGRLTLNLKLQIWGRLSTTRFCWWSLPFCIKDPHPLDIPPSRFPCCVLSYFSLVFVMEHNSPIQVIRVSFLDALASLDFKLSLSEWVSQSPFSDFQVVTESVIHLFYS